MQCKPLPAITRLGTLPSSCLTWDSPSHGWLMASSLMEVHLDFIELCYKRLPPIDPQTACHSTFSLCLWEPTEHSSSRLLEKSPLDGNSINSLIAPYSSEMISISLSHSTATLWTLNNSPNFSLPCYSHGIFTFLLPLLSNDIPPLISKFRNCFILMYNQAPECNPAGRPGVLPFLPSSWFFSS